jgi:hypothetical protein
MKGSDCLEQFASMQKCMQGYPELFEEKKSKEELAEEAIVAEEEKAAAENLSGKDIVESPKDAPSEKAADAKAAELVSADT